MEVSKTVSIEVNEGEQYYFGDQITVRMKELGNFTATVQAIEEDSVVFMFDDIITKHNHNDIQEWLDKDILPLFPETFNVTDITLPTCGQIFGDDEWCREFFEPDTDEQFELMKRRGNRVCDYDGDWEWWWLKNKSKKYAPGFAFVNYRGYAGSNTASNSLGVRPVFRIKK